MKQPTEPKPETALTAEKQYEIISLKAKMPTIVKTGEPGHTQPRYAGNLNPMQNPFKNKYVLIFLCLFVLVGCVTALTGGSAFVQEHSLAILIVFLLIILILDLIT